MPGVHAVLSASGAKRWLACPPSARLEDRLSGVFGEQSSPYAAEGTKAHSLAELKLRKEIGEINEFSYTEQLKALGEIPADMERATSDYLDVVMTRFYTAKKACADAQLLIEQRLDYATWVPHGFGTGDCVIVSDATLEVLDYKHGKGIPVSAIDNPQARLYGLGALQIFGTLYGFTHVRNTIVQPRVGEPSEETLTREELLAWGESIKPIAEQAWRGEGEFCPGEHCRFCAAKALCAARTAKAQSAFTQAFKDPALLKDEDITDVLKIADLAESWLKDVRAYALNQAKRGQEFRGWKLVRGRKPNKAWKNNEETINQLSRAGYTPDQYMDSKLKSVSGIEKLLGKTAFKALLGTLWNQGDGNLTLVSEEDKRVAYSSAEADFSDMT